jgi:hypothetical protein
MSDGTLAAFGDSGKLRLSGSEDGSAKTRIFDVKASIAHPQKVNPAGLNVPGIFVLQSYKWLGLS